MRKLGFKSSFKNQYDEADLSWLNKVRTPFEFWAIFAVALLSVAILPLLSYQDLSLIVSPFREYPTTNETENQSTVWDARPSENAKAYLKEGSMLEIYSISSSIRGDTES